MITALVQFPLGNDATLADATAIFRTTAPRYLGMPGLQRKYYVFDSATRRAGGCYLVQDLAAAAQIFDAAWRQVVKEKYGAEPEITLFDTPVIVDNLLGAISTDVPAGVTHGVVAHNLFGQGAEPVIVMHDWTSTSESYAPVRSLLDSSAFSYCFMEHRGYGRSKGMKGSYTAKEAAADVVAVADALGWRRFHLIGHSMSGQIAQRVALDHGDRLKSMVAVTPVPAGSVPADEDSVAMFAAAATDDEKWKSIAKMLTGERLGERWYDQKLQSFRANVAPEAFLGFLKMWTREDFAAELGVRDTPALVVLGAHDFDVFQEANMRQTIGAHFPKAEFTVLTEAGHFPMAETPLRFVRVVEDFMRRHAG